MPVNLHSNAPPPPFGLASRIPFMQFWAKIAIDLEHHLFLNFFIIDAIHSHGDLIS